MRKVNNVAIVGVTTWGITLAIMASKSQNNKITLLSRTEAEATNLSKEGECSRFLPGVRFPNSFTITASVKDAISNANIIILAVPSHSFRRNIAEIAPAIPSHSILVSATKGLEMPNKLRMSEIVGEELSKEICENLCVISGPNLAKEIVGGKPSSSVVASNNIVNAQLVRDVLMQPTFRIYTSDDVIGVELCGTLKNIIAIGAGIVDGLELGDNSKAAYITRGIAEISRLGTSLGASAHTFAGLAGVGDIVATSFSKLSRNRYLGEQIALGRTLEQITYDMQNVIEGLETTRAAVELGELLGVELPITQAIYKILFEGMQPQQGIQELMNRPPTSE